MKDDFLIRITKLSISLMKRSLRTNYGLFAVSFALFILNIFILCFTISTHLWVTGIAIGVTGMNCLWIWMMLWETRLDLRLEKEKLEWLEKRDESYRPGSIIGAGEAVEGIRG